MSGSEPEPQRSLGVADMTAVSDRNTLRLAANVLGVLIIVAVVAPFVVYAVPSVVGADHGLVILSGSMEPKRTTSP